jgi:N-acetylmuramoyl-L-alanine amidase
VLVSLVLFTSFEPQPVKPYGLTKVVIDAGHGGRDPGCLGKKSKEKDIALAISLKLGKYIEENYPDVKVIYTRTTDEFLELHQRADIANNAKADLFICIHCNSACFFNKKKKKEVCNSETMGVESWVMGLHKSDENLEVAKRENEVVLFEKDYTKEYEGFDPNSPEADIIFSLYQNTFLEQSLRMASLVQQEMKVAGRPLRGVKQAGFLVLFKTYMPSILIETGFLSNAEEERFLASQKGQDQMAKSIFKAFRAYKNSVDAPHEGLAAPSVKDTPEPKKSTEPKELKKTSEGAVPVVTDGVVKSKLDTSTAVPPKKEVLAAESVVVVPVETNSSQKESLRWSVQFHTSPKPINDNHKIYSEFKDVREDFENGVYKYSTGNLVDKNEAIRLQTTIREMGYKDAFVIAFLNNKKISMKEALQVSGKK